MKKWWPIPSSKQKDIIQWSPYAGNNLRVKGNGGNWRYGKCRRAKFALSAGERLIAQDELLPAKKEGK